MISNIIAFSDPGDRIILQTPVYPPFRQCIVNSGRIPAVAPLRREGMRYEMDFAAIEAALRSGAKVILFCNPQNPTGRVFDKVELTRVAELAATYDAVVVSDEIHADIVFPGHKHIPFASLGDDAAGRTVTLTSATKAFNIPGLRCGIMHFSDESLHDRFRKAIPDQLIGNPNITGMRATIAAWQDGGDWLDAVMADLGRNRLRLSEALNAELAPLNAVMPEGTYMTWIDAGALDTCGMAPFEWIRANARVAVNDGKTFGVGSESFIRLNFATPQNIFGEILERIATALRGL